jgi:hypothetical protein
MTFSLISTAGSTTREIIIQSKIQDESRNIPSSVPSFSWPAVVPNDWRNYRPLRYLPCAHSYGSKVYASNLVYDPGFLYTFMYMLYRIIVDLCS